MINKGQINCVRDAGHDIPNFLIDSGELRLDKVTLYKEFRVICDNLDVSRYYESRQKWIVLRTL